MLGKYYSSSEIPAFVVKTKADAHKLLHSQGYRYSKHQKLYYNDDAQLYAALHKTRTSGSLNALL